MSKFINTVKSKYYWIAKGQGEIYKMLNAEINKRGDAAKLSEKIGFSKGYVSQLLNGNSDINPTWNKIVEFCLALDKVPVLEIKSTSEYLLEQNRKAIINHFTHNLRRNCLNPEKLEPLPLNTYRNIYFLEENKLEESTNILSSFDYQEYEFV
jgi:transcriptional regulator with XRE-family HTH domain